MNDVRLVLALWAEEVCTDTKGDNDHEAYQKGPSATAYQHEFLHECSVQLRW